MLTISVGNHEYMAVVIYFFERGQSGLVANSSRGPKGWTCFVWWCSFLPLSFALPNGRQSCLSTFLLTIHGWRHLHPRLECRYLHLWMANWIFFYECKKSLFQLRDHGWEPIEAVRWIIIEVVLGRISGHVHLMENGERVSIFVEVDCRYW